MSLSQSMRAAALLAVPVLGFSSAAGAALVGNELRARAQASDGATEVFQVYRTDPIPGPGVVSSFSTFNQAGAGNFNAYVLRPTGNANEYSVVFDSGPKNIAGSQGNFVATFQHAPVAVQANDLIAHYRTGIPYDDGGEDPNFIYFPTPTPPSQGQTITLGGAGFPENPNFNRTYSFAAKYRAAGAGPLGNDLSYVRGNGSDGATQVLNVYQNSPVPEAGSLDTISFRYQTGPGEDASGREFRFLVLRPTANPGEVNVVYDSGTLAQISDPGQNNTVQTLSLPDQNGAADGSVSVQAGDLIAHYGRGIAFTILGAEQGAGTDNIYFPVDPVPGSPFTLGGAGVPLFNQERDYALSANFTPIPEPAALSLLALSGLALLGRRRGR